MHRVEALADRPAGTTPHGVIPFKRLVPLEEIIAAAFGQGVGTVAVRQEYDRLVDAGGSELHLLLALDPEELKTFVPPRILEGILRVRKGALKIAPGYDGVYGTIEIFGEEEKGEATPAAATQMQLF
jgi:PHP family Zn ribbon phosphoesterase